MKPTTQPPRRAMRRTCALGSLCLFFSFQLAAQTTPPPTATSTLKTAVNDEPVTLSVFEVTSDQDKGYAASSALTGTRTNEKLENLPNSISVMTHDFLEDLALNNYFDAVGFATNAENIANDLGTIGAVVGNRSGTAPARCRIPITTSS